MKKIWTLTAVAFVFLLAGCGAKQEEKTMTCTRTATQSNMNINLNYEVKYKGNYVTSVKSTEKIISEDTSMLEQYKTMVEETYSPYKDVKYYEYNVSVDGNTLTSIAEIDYEKIDTDKMIEIDSANSQLIKDGKISVDDIESLYNSVGATCKK